MIVTNSHGRRSKMSPDFSWTFPLGLLSVELLYISDL